MNAKNVNSFHIVATRAIGLLLLQGSYAYDGSGCEYLTSDGKSCLIGLLLKEPGKAQGIMSGLTSRLRDGHLDPGYESFHAMLERDLQLPIDLELAKLLDCLQCMHDTAACDPANMGIPPTFEALQFTANRLNYRFDYVEAKAVFLEYMNDHAPGMLADWLTLRTMDIQLDDPEYIPGHPEFDKVHALIGDLIASEPDNEPNHEADAYIVPATSLIDAAATHSNPAFDLMDKIMDQVEANLPRKPNA